MAHRIKKMKNVCRSLKGGVSECFVCAMRENIFRIWDNTSHKYRKLTRI